MQNTSDTYHYSAWQDQQEAFIASLQFQPLAVVLRPEEIDFREPYLNNPLFSLIEQLQWAGVKHIEIAWSQHPSWICLMQVLKTSFTDISLGAASITNSHALDSILELGLDYAMTPIWNPTMQLKARKLKQLLVPGVFSPTEIHQAKCFGCQLIKLFPASTLGVKYINHLKAPIRSLPFIIAAGGLTVDDVNPWLKEGYGAIALGRGLIQNHQIDPLLQKWLKDRESQSNHYTEST
ncbi:bifunctional 4-hydroxy-2-oxoglutarate aldolase/2-dehydro-3-deoxy-phosphogluconate aldolase [Prochlorococcus sp. MIT 1307]|uniref:bifunctional 4-hydroxy-2-oxoglutarate aldolase/2-dehydro-3-deoxy-phosphogluconate aldolase n=1 Tax=Prochlorococcus sp. MIT 1307 TaxID=3096219 RepID=UPI002A75A9A1|nr:bifunctional 4-hydroxy-2-oxoglutarate aldolase/2-dehydro-3-deoxy-phosphogluconate aldolase [Prochlorococcus sp. MIT 1307]